MRTTRRTGFFLLFTLVSVWSCGGKKEDVVGPSPVPSSSSTFSLGGTVVDSETRVGVAGVAVTIVDGPDKGAVASTDSGGSYRFAALQQAGFTVSVSAPAYIPQSLGVTLTANRQIDFSLRHQPASTTLTGRVTDAVSGGGLAGAVVSINGRYRVTADGSGNFTVLGLLDYGLNLNFTYVAAANYVADYRYIRGAVQNVRLRPIERITAGDSRVVTIEPTDTLCVNNAQDMPGVGPDYVCHTLFVVAPVAGAVTIEALSLQDGAHPPLEVETVGSTRCCSERLGNPTTIDVAAGTVIAVNVEMLASAAANQSFTVTTSPPR